MSKKGLGKGLGALFPDVDRESIREIEIARIRPNPHQPRQRFDPERLAELAASIREHGIVQPVLVRPVQDGYELVAGERRWRAAQMAGLDRVPAVVRDFTAAQVMEIALIENLQREDLNPLEEAEAYRRLLEEFGLTQEELARRLGKSRPQVTNTLRLLQLPAAVQAALREGRLTMGHAKVLLGVDPALAEVLAERVLAEGLSVRELERLVQEAPGRRPRRADKEGSPVRGAAGGRNPELAAVEGQLRERLGTLVRVVPGSPRGRIEIYFYGEEDLARLVDLIAGAEGPAGTGPAPPGRGAFTV